MDSPPPTQTSKPGPCSGWSTPTKATSLISCATSWCGEPLIAVLNLRGRLENASSPTQRSTIARIAGVPSMISSAATPATGEPRTTRGVSPQASVVSRPTSSRRSQIAGTSSTRIQCSWMFWRSVRSAVSRAVGRRDVGDGPQLGDVELAAVAADAQHEVLVVELVRLQDGRTAAVDARLALGVEPPPAEPPAQVGRVDRGEPAVGVDVLDPGAHVQAVVVLLDPLVGVQRLEVAQRPLTLAALAARRQRPRRACGEGSVVRSTGGMKDVPWRERL